MKKSSRMRGKVRVMVKPEMSKTEREELVKELKACADRIQHLKALVMDALAEIETLREHLKKKVEELRKTRLYHEWWFILTDLLMAISETKVERGEGKLLSSDLDTIANLDLFNDLDDIFTQLISLRLHDDCTIPISISEDNVYIHIAPEGIDIHPPDSRRVFIRRLIKYADVIAPHLREPIREAFLELTTLAKDFKFLDELEIVREGSFRVWLGEEPVMFDKMRLYPLAPYSIELSKADATYIFGLGEAEALFELYGIINEMFSEWAAKVLEIREHNKKVIRKMKNVLAVYILSEKL